LRWEYAGHQYGAGVKGGTASIAQEPFDWTNTMIGGHMKNAKHGAYLAIGLSFLASATAISS
jgi:hypothetical protein